jgi:hypothetical protein
MRRIQPSALAGGLFGYEQPISTRRTLVRAHAAVTPAALPQWAELSDRELARWATGLTGELAGRVSATRGRGGRPELERAVEELPGVLERLRQHRSKPRARRRPAASSIHSGKRNAIRAALSAGVKPTQVAKHFGLPLSAISTLASEPGEKA